MYTNTAYEALYQLMGLRLQEEVTSALTSAVVFRALMTLLFAAGFFTFMVHFVSKSMPFFLPTKRAPLANLAALMLGLFVGISILKVGGASETSKNYAGQSWADNPYVLTHDPKILSEYRVSWLFKIASGSAEEIAKFLGVIVDRAFARTNSQLTAPNYFYKAILGAAADTIDDPSLKDGIRFFTDECLTKVLPRFNPESDYSSLDRIFSRYSAADRKLASITLASGVGPSTTCLDVKTSLNSALTDYARSKSVVLRQVNSNGSSVGNGVGSKFFGQNFENYVTSSLLVSQFIGNREAHMGLEKGTELPGTGGRIFQYLNRLKSMDGILTAIGMREMKGASVAAERSLELSDHLARAPHVAGFLKMLLIAFFPVLAFFLAAGKFRPVAWWWITYLSICLWSPIWTLLYHVITTLALNLEVLNAFGKLGDGVSLYAASLISARLYQAFAVYAWLQLLVGPALTGSLLIFLRPILSDSTADTVPDAAKTLGGLASKAFGPASKAGAVSGVPS